MAAPQKTIPKSETLSRETNTRLEYNFFDENLQPIHLSKVEYKNEPKIIIYPFSYTEARGLTKKRVSEIEFRGWNRGERLPKLLKPGVNISLSHKKIAPLMRALYSKYPSFNKLVVDKRDGRTRFSEKTITFSLVDLERICKALAKEIATFDIRKKASVAKSLAEISTNFSPQTHSLPKGGLKRFLSLYEGDFELSAADTDEVLRVIDKMPLGNVAVTENFIETKNKINKVYLELIIEKFETLLDVKSDNEKDWQDFFEKYGWILASVFPYQVLLRAREAYLGGKTIENKEGRVVDFLYQNDFKDNYALLEIKTHTKRLLKEKPYRGEDAFSMHDDCSGAIAQCLDQKSTFLTDMGGRYPSLDPKVVLVIGQKRLLTDNQKKSFELVRNNQKNVDIVTFDELLEKIYGLKSILSR